MVATARPSSLQFLAALSLLVAFSLALPDVGDARHKRPKRRNSIARIVIDGMPVPASGAFTCVWSEVPFHDYGCNGGRSAGTPTFGLVAPFMNPPEPRPPHLLEPARNYPHRNEVDGWGGNFPLASPNIAPEFGCHWAESGTPQSEEYNWRCSFDYDGYTHRFLVSDIASVSYEASNDSQQWFVPCDGVGPCPEVDTAGPRIDVTKGPVRLTRSGVAKVRLLCRTGEVSPPCTGRLRLAVKRGGRRLGSRRFELTPDTAKRVRVRLGRRARALVAERGSVRVRATVRAHDSIGNVRTTTRTFILRSP